MLLFPFYWMALTAIKPDEQLLDLEKFNPFWTWNPTLKHIYKLLFETVLSAVAVEHDVCRGLRHRPVDRRQRARGLCHRAAALPRRAVGRRRDLPRLSVPPSILFIPLSTVVFQYGLFDTPFALILTYPTILIPFSTWLLMGYFKTIPFELEECALIDGASRWQILTKIVLPLAIPGLISAFIFCFTLCWNEFIYALTFLSSTQNKTVPVAIVNEFVDGDIYRWGSLMAGALVGSLPLVILYAFFVEHYVSAMTGAVKE